MTTIIVISYMPANTFVTEIVGLKTKIAMALVETGEGSNEADETHGSNTQNGYSPANPNLGNKYANSSANKSTNELSLSSLISKGSPVLGKASAPITIIEFGDFQCHFCDRFAKQTEPQINASYVQTGKVSLVFKNFVTHGPDSLTAAIAGQCTNDQGKFWNFYRTLFDNQGEENSGWASKDNVKKFASQIPGLNTQKFNVCLDSGKYNSMIDKDNALAISSGFQGTPTFIIEKSDGSKAETLLGAYPFPSFQVIIDKKLSE